MRRLLIAVVAAVSALVPSTAHAAWTDYNDFDDLILDVWCRSKHYVSGSGTWQNGYTCYRPGQWSFWPLEGEREGSLHFCGEHTSPDFQGWMEGAAETGEEHGVPGRAGERRDPRVLAVLGVERVDEVRVALRVERARTAYVVVRDSRGGLGWRGFRVSIAGR